MKKLLSLSLVLLLILSLTACTSEPPAPQPVETPAEETPADETPAEEEPAPAEEKINVGLVTDTGGIDDKSFNQGTWEGVVRYAEENGLVLNEDYSFLQSISDADYIPNLSQYADQEADLIVAAGFLFEKAIDEISTNYPDQKILFIDAVVDAPNVMSAVFAEHEGSFLVGVAAALKAQEAGKDMVGFVGGADFDLIQRFEAGFEQGVKAVAPDMQIVVQYASGFDKAEEGQSLATKMFDDGCYVIYHAAGGTGNGVIKEAKDRATEGQDVWVIGVDKDQYEEGFFGDGSKSVILTSMLKGVDEAAYQACKEVAAGTFAGGVRTFDLKADGVRIPDNNPNLTDEWVSIINEFAEKIKAGEIEVDPVPSRLKEN
ncbi:MAG: BMP family ABC transporter substrate-binding protein [Bacillota bacterium]|nr:BMP family ABC transporter substrate-binding protein [Bacillota bacterium]